MSKKESINVKVFNMMTNKSEAKLIVKHANGKASFT